MEMDQYQIIISRALPGMKLDHKEQYAETLAVHTRNIDESVQRNVNHGEENHRALEWALSGALHHLAGVALMYGYTLEDLATTDLQRIQKEREGAKDGKGTL